ncbi:hypothetical protein FRC11_014905, partial [Ceratobasidium sp. 423]
MSAEDVNIMIRYPTKCFLPPEVIAHIIELGTLDDMKRWREVSRGLKEVVDRSPIFPYLVQLKQLGYVEPADPRKDLTYREKAEVLRGHRKKLQRLAGSDYLVVDFQGIEEHRTHFSFFKGLFAHLGALREDTSPGAIAIYEIPSLKRSLSQCGIWSLEPPEPTKEYYIDKSTDLVVFFVYDSNVPILEVDLCSLTAGGDHPAAAKPRLEFPITGILEKVYCYITGDYLMVLLDGESLDDSYDIVVWDWPSGKQVMHTRAEGRDSFAFVLPNILVLPSSLSKPDEELELIGYVDIFTFDPDGDNGSPRHIATLQLPEITDKTAITYATVCSSRTPFLKSRTVPVSETEARLYDISPDDGVVCLKIIYFPSVEGEENMTRPRPSSSGFLLIHHTSILDIIHSLPQSNHPHVVPWSKWAHKTVWTGASTENVHIKQISTFGHLVAFLKQRKVVIYDLRPCFLNDAPVCKPRYKLARVAMLDSLFKAGENRSCEPKILTSFNVPRDIVLVEPSIIMDEEYVILVQDSEWEFGGEMYWYNLYQSSEEFPQYVMIS